MLDEHLNHLPEIYFFVKIESGLIFEGVGSNTQGSSKNLSWNFIPLQKQRGLNLTLNLCINPSPCMKIKLLVIVGKKSFVLFPRERANAFGNLSDVMAIRLMLM